MRVNFFQFYKSQKAPKDIEGKINALLSESSFKYAQQQESPTTGKITLSIFTEPGEGKTKLKVFRDSDFGAIEKQMNEFLSTEKIKMRQFMFTYTGNTIVGSLFFD